MAEEEVVSPHEKRERSRNSFLSDTEVHRASHFVRGVVLAVQRFLSSPKAQHLPEQRQYGVAAMVAYSDVLISANAGYRTVG